MREEIVKRINERIYRVLDESEVLRQDALLRETLLYALAFQPDGTPLKGGKRLRPLFTCLICGMLSGSYEPAVDYGVSLELLHNFTLIHDDIEDNGFIRHNRPAVWKKFGLASALNAGDLLFERSLSLAAATDPAALTKMMYMSEALFLGQHRDIAFEDRCDITEDEYLRMIGGKTGALFGASFAFGALAAKADAETVARIESSGRSIGLAFQIRDDYLGTWGKSDMLGKSVSGDIMERKNTLAVVYSSQKDLDFRYAWAKYDGNAEEAPEFADWMTELGAPDYLDEQCRKYSRDARTALASCQVDNRYSEELDNLIGALAGRNK